MNRTENTILANGLIVTLNPNREILEGSIQFKNGRITQISHQPIVDPTALRIDVSGQFVIPGLIQAHTHLCQTLFRGEADDLELLDWLRQRIWPMEHAHTAESLSASARLGLVEMQLLGTTTVLDMGTVQHTQALLKAVAESHMRYVGGKCLMDLKGSSGLLFESRKQTLFETHGLIEQWHDPNGLIQYALCPRFAVSCSDRLMRDCRDLQSKYNLIIHTHASESRAEVDLILKRTGRRNVDYLDDLGLINEKSVIVHGIHLSAAESKKMAKKKATIVHCPSSNLKLASGVAPIQTYDEMGISLAVGSDGAPCNNTMDPFLEMRLMALLQKPKYGPRALRARRALEISTLGGAYALGLQDRIGSLEIGKAADIVTVERSHPSVGTVEDPYSALVYSCSGRDVQNVWIDGRSIVRNRQSQVFDSREVIQHANRELHALKKRAAI